MYSKIYSICIIIIAIQIVCQIFSKFIHPKLRQMAGEDNLSIKLNRLSQKNYIVLENVMLQTERGITQADFILVSRYGIFVILSKEEGGWIIGSEEEYWWQQNIYGNTNQFRNPLQQNAECIKDVESVLKEDEQIPFVSIVSFPKDTKLRIETTQNVLTIKEVGPVIKSYKKEYLTEEHMQEIAEKLIDHNSDVKKMNNHYEDKEYKRLKAHIGKGRKEICPKCGKKLG